MSETERRLARRGADALGLALACVGLVRLGAALVPAPTVDRPIDIPFSAVSDGDGVRIWWFVDDAFVGASAPHETPWRKARGGDFTVRAVDANGRVGEAALHVETTPAR